MVAPVVILAAVAAVAALLVLEEPPPWLAWCPAWLGAVIVAVLGVAGTWWLEPWTARRQGAADEDQQAVDRLRRYLGRQQGLPRIGERGAGGLLLRVHEAIPLDLPPEPAAGAKVLRRAGWLRRWSGPVRLSGEGPDPDLPAFVERDIGKQVCAWMRAASREGGFLVLVGNSSVGKTRLLYESARSELAGFVVLAPDLGDGALVNVIADATFPLPKLIVWLDELQRFLPGPYFVTDDQDSHTAITAATVRKLLTADTPVVIVGTLWPQYATELRTVQPDPASVGQSRYPAAIDILTT
ncbi:hypothetical protein [Actinacidiphila oryziradicis]|uniref:Uncharacterized protein n=1 Tax=Actinacidiphila oryziradicis TaxID=2571141 RepID=A0A4U0SK85_9ACTN|nr:hypothetical protein [Actinacidiphila oryziradicis]TKA08501.1 hypothetical protein FCI23_27730 [Actinacidiphila oryziradicis]